jgi:putative hydrolase of the HAD superfamily
MTIKAVIFDIGGVLEITPSLGVDEAWAQKWGLDPMEMAKKLQHVWRDGGLGLMSEAEVHAAIGEALNISAEQVDAYMADVWREYLGTLNIELANYFRSLHATYKTGIISNSFVGARERETALYHFDEMTHVIVYSHEAGMRKPDPRIYTICCEKLGIAPNEAIFLDDREQAVEAACALGMHGLVFTDTQKAIADIEACLRTC